MKTENTRLPYRGTKCQNCLTPLDTSDRYCSYCGQINSTKRLSLSDFFSEFFAGLFAYDSRLHRTLHALLLQPGKISKDYIEGKRQRYANPYRFYLSASIIFFIIWSLSSNFGEAPRAYENAETDTGQTASDSISTSNPNAPESVFSFHDTSKSLEEIYQSEESLDSLDFWEAAETKLSVFSAFYVKNKIKEPEEALIDLNYTTTTYNKWLYKKVVDMDLFSANPDLFLSYFVGKLPFIIFFCLPVFAVFIWLLYLRRPFTYMEHLIFTFHNQTVLFILLIIMVLLQSLFDTSSIRGAIILLFLIYLYKAMRRFYRQGRIKTFIKFIVLNGIFTILAMLVSMFALFASFAIY